MIKRYIERKIYLNKIKPFINKDIIKVLTGQRRVGKSYLLYQVMDVLIKDYKVKKENIVYINKESHDYEEIVGYKDLIKYINNHKSKNNKKLYLFIDEVQDIENFEKALRHFHAKGGYDIYVTGSNANMLSGELATYLSGRSIHIDVYGLSYLEFLEFHNMEKNESSFLKFIKYGGLPYLKNLELSDEIVYDYLRNIYNTILFRDVVARNNIRNINFLEKLVEYLGDNVGSLVSAKKISDFLKSQKIMISPNKVLDYISNLCSAYFIFKVKRSEIGGKKVFEINEKYYFEDLGLRHAIIGYKQVDINKILENIVYLHLRLSGYSITVGKLGNKEIDFVCEKEGSKIYVQVAYLISNQSVKEREFGNLLLIQDNYPKYVVSMDSLAGGQVEGVKHVNIIDFISRNI